MMAMTDADPMLDDTHDTIRRACASLGLRGERIDDRKFTGQITEKVLNSIRIAEYVIADLTHERPNVYYEIGFADALGKPIILTAKDGTKVHFDLQGHRILYYRNMKQLEQSLAAMLQGLRTVASPKTRPSPPSN